MSLEILLGKGIGDLRFGQLEPQVIEVLGKPDKIDESEGSKHLLYFELQMEVWFEHEHEDRLGWIVLRHPEVTLFGQKLMYQTTETVLLFVSAHIPETPDHDDYGSLETYLYERPWLELQFELNWLTSINLGVPFNEDDTPNWPKL